MMEMWLNKVIYCGTHLARIPVLSACRIYQLPPPPYPLITGVLLGFGADVKVLVQPCQLKPA